ncbi:MAG: hypothetical protein NZM42_03690 [Gemmatales bacterium]|nr:hypothetical protein [Gemmatales bacterium]MDW8222493.1 hypothetical protein [Gemmatales bacterium]
MREPLTWSFAIGRWDGIAIRIHLLFALFTVGMVARGLAGGYAAAAFLMQALLFASVLLHEFGHCYAGRRVGGDATEILLWPLGGLANVQVPFTPRAHLWTTLGGPAVNLAICLLTASFLLITGWLPPLSPTWDWAFLPSLVRWQTGEMHFLHDPLTFVHGRSWFSATFGAPAVALFLARLFYVNWMLFWFNILLVGFPLDGGRILQCALWPHFGYDKATRTAVYCGWIVALLLTLYVMVTFEGSTGADKLMLFFLALFIYQACRQEMLTLEMGVAAEGFGWRMAESEYSLEERAEEPRKKKPGLIQRWLQWRAERRRRREEQQRLEEERRLDQILEKVNLQGLHSLTEEERRFLNRVSAKYRNRHSSS